MTSTLTQRLTHPRVAARSRAFLLRLVNGNHRARAIFNTSNLVLSDGSSGRSPVDPRNCKPCSSALMRTPGGAHWLPMTRSASRWALDSMPGASPESPIPTIGNGVRSIRLLPSAASRGATGYYPDSSDILGIFPWDLTIVRWVSINLCLSFWWNIPSAASSRSPAYCV